MNKTQGQSKIRKASCRVSAVGCTASFGLPQEDRSQFYGLCFLLFALGGVGPATEGAVVSLRWDECADGSLGFVPAGLEACAGLPGPTPPSPRLSGSSMRAGRRVAVGSIRIIKCVEMRDIVHASNRSGALRFEALSEEAQPALPRSRRVFSLNIHLHHGAGKDKGLRSERIGVGKTQGRHAYHNYLPQSHTM